MNCVTCDNEPSVIFDGKFRRIMCDYCCVELRPNGTRVPEYKDINLTHNQVRQLIIDSYSDLAKDMA